MKSLATSVLLVRVPGSVRRSVVTNGELKDDSRGGRCEQHMRTSWGVGEVEGGGGGGAWRGIGWERVERE